MAEFKEGDEVEVWGANMYPWRRAKIVRHDSINLEPDSFIIEFQDGTRGHYQTNHIRAVKAQP